VTAHRRPQIPFSDAPQGTCRWCGDPILHESGPLRGEPNRRRRWHPACVDLYNVSDPREARRLVRKRDKTVCAACGVNTNKLRRELRTQAAKDSDKTQAKDRNKASKGAGKKRAGAKTRRQSPAAGKRASTLGLTRLLRERGFKTRKSLWELDHIVPLIDGGGHGLDNLQTLCTPCHKAKTIREARERAARRALGQVDEGPVTTATAVAASATDSPPDRRGARRRPNDSKEPELDAMIDHATRLNEKVERWLAELQAGATR
jgi:5-methylcytosine-specific restriction endonuclease McrA